ncbi:MAG TPA: thermonuclease family protein [Chryseolinea sp.]|nr:thermonuclease family protein [Chryseolinea sp.]
MRALLIIICFFSCSTEQQTGKVVKVVDGDTFDLMSDKKIRIRMFGIDSPERGQSFSVKAKEFTAGLIAGKEITVTIINKDRYGRFVCDVYLDNGTSVNAEIVKAGYAWHFTRYSNDDELVRLQEEARASKRGLWQDSNPVPPWEFRRR